MRGARRAYEAVSPVAAAAGTMMATPVPCGFCPLTQSLLHTHLYISYSTYISAPPAQAGSFS